MGGGMPRMGGGGGGGIDSFYPGRSNAARTELISKEEAQKLGMGWKQRTALNKEILKNQGTQIGADASMSNAATAAASRDGGGPMGGSGGSGGMNLPSFSRSSGSKAPTTTTKKPGKIFTERQTDPISGETVSVNYTVDGEGNVKRLVPQQFNQLPRNKKHLSHGETYQLPNGQLGKWSDDDEMLTRMQVNEYGQAVPARQDRK